MKNLMILIFWLYARYDYMIIWSCDYMLDIYKTRYILDKIKKNNEKFDDTNILIGTDDKLPDNITLKNFVILIIFVIKDDGKLCPQIFKKHCLLNKHGFPQDSGIDA